MKKSYSRPVLTVHGSATQQTQGLVLGMNQDFNGEYRKRIPE
jgi:hypothetical protein